LSSPGELWEPTGADGKSGDGKSGDGKSGDGKSRLHKQSPPSETKKGSGNLQSNQLNEIFTTRVGGFCLCSRDFNRLVIIRPETLIIPCIMNQGLNLNEFRS